MKTATAWESIGWDDGKFRIKGGRAIYEAVLYNCKNAADNVKLARLEVGNFEPDKPLFSSIREISRYVPPDTVLEFFDDAAFDRHHPRANP
ncbi:MAG: hypothetical protein AB7I98_03965 [Verrucomicrobiales bacterium]